MIYRSLWMTNFWTGIQKTKLKWGLSLLGLTTHCSCTTCKYNIIKNWAELSSDLHFPPWIPIRLQRRCSLRCIRPTEEELENFGTPDFTIYNAGKFPCNRYTHYMTSSTSVDLHIARKEMVILGTMYAGEMKKGLFSVMHYLMPKRQILSLHSGCNMGKSGDVALFFGLSGKYYRLIIIERVCGEAS